MTRSKTFKMMAACLALAYAAFFAPLAWAGGYGQGVSASVVKKASVTADGKRIEFPRSDEAEVTVATVSIAPGAETGWHRHPNPVYAYVLSGSLEVDLENGQKLSYNKGDAIIEVVDTPHNGRNTGTEPVELVVVYPGSAGEPLTVKLGPEKSAAP